MVDEIRQVGNYIRLPFEILGKVLNFLLGNLFTILLLGIIVFVIWKYWFYIAIVFLKIYDKIKGIKHGEIKAENNN